jgi:hypothetical protein
MNKHHTSPKSRLATLRWLPTLFFLAAAGCGGGGGDSSPPAGETPAPAPAPAPGPAPAPAPTPAMPAVVDGGSIDATARVGTVMFPSGVTATGGTGSPVGGLNCGPAIQTVAYYTQLSIWQNGTQIALPDRAGIVRDAAGNLQCVYPVHTHTGDLSGRIHKEGPDNTTYTLGNFFAVWGEPLTAGNVAGLTTTPMSVYIIDGGAITQFTGDPATIELKSHRHIAIVLGTAVAQLPFYTWVGN